MDGTWTRQLNELKKLVGWHAAVANSNSLTVAQTVQLFNAHLNAKLAYRFQVMPPSTVWKSVEKMNAVVARAVSNRAGSEVVIRQQAVSVVTGLILPTTVLLKSFAACAADTLNKGGQGTVLARRRMRCSNSRWRSGLSKLSKEVGLELAMEDHRPRGRSCNYKRKKR